MIKYVSYAVTFSEVPDEVSLTVQVSNCTHRCPGCHSAYLQQDIGEDLERDLPALLERYAGRVSCVCFMGDGDDWYALHRCFVTVHHAGLRVALYTGDSFEDFKPFLSSGYYGTKGIPDYLKVGMYVEQLGGLESGVSNQRMYKLMDGEYRDVTWKFFRERIEDTLT